MAAVDSRRILLVDDEPHLVRAIRMYLELQGYAVFDAHSGEDGLEAVREKLPDLVVLDILMPGLDGFETLEELRGFSNVPVILLTARGEEEHKVRGLALGADDYVTKPFGQRELLARIQAVLRRAEQPAHLPKTQVQVDEELLLDFDRGEVMVGGERVHLTPTEYRLLYHLASNPGRLMPTESLLARVWGQEYREEEHYVRLYVSYLRQKIEPDPAHPKYILTVPGLGYKFVDYRATPTRQSSRTRRPQLESPESSTARRPPRPARSARSPPRPRQRRPATAQSGRWHHSPPPAAASSPPSAASWPGWRPPAAAPPWPAPPPGRQTPPTTVPGRSSFATATPRPPLQPMRPARAILAGKLCSSAGRPTPSPTPV